MSASRIISASLPSFCQKLSKLVEIWRTSDKNNFAQFFETRCIHAFELVLVVTSIVRGPGKIRDEVGTTTRPWTILNMVVSLWFFRQCSRVGHCSFSSVTDTLLWCLWSPDTTKIAAVRFTLSTLSIFFGDGVPHCTAVLQGRPQHFEMCDLLRLFLQYFRLPRWKFNLLLDFFVMLSTWVLRWVMDNFCNNNCQLLQKLSITHWRAIIWKRHNKNQLSCFCETPCMYVYLDVNQGGTNGNLYVQTHWRTGFAYQKLGQSELFYRFNACTSNNKIAA